MVTKRQAAEQRQFPLLCDRIDPHLLISGLRTDRFGFRRAIDESGHIFV
jgi:hypothetical protein